MEYSFKLNVGSETRIVGQEELQRYANSQGLTTVATGRCSWLFIFKLYLFETAYGIEAPLVVEEIKRLEVGKEGFGTKPATKFEREPLRGWWHKHFTGARFIAKNMANELAGGRMREIANEVFDPQKSPVVTREMISEWSRRVVREPIECRDREGRLTGEWIIFAKHGGSNYYLSLSTHDQGDQAIYDEIKTVCFSQFPCVFEK